VSALSADLELLADPVRVRLLALIEVDELTVGELARILSLPQPTVSRQLKSLLQGDWIGRRTVGTAAYLRLAAMDGTRQELWRIIRQDPALTGDLGADRDHMARVLAERQSDAGTFFGRVAAGWDVLRDQLFGRRFMAPALAALVPPDATIIDLGCGTGEVLAHLRAALDPTAGRVIGVDREPGMLAIARQRLAEIATESDAQVEIIEASLESVPLPDAVADVALLFLVLHHLPDPAAVMAEARRLLAPTGRLVLVDMQPHATTAWRTFGHLHQGFADAELATLAADAGLALRTLRHLPPDPDAQGPPLFVATLTPLTAIKSTGKPASRAARKRK